MAKKILAWGIALASSLALAGCSANSSSTTTLPLLVTMPTTASPEVVPSASSAAATPTSAPTPAAPLPQKVVLPRGVIDPTKLPSADPAIVAAIRTGSNSHFLVNYLATIDQAARTHDAAALNHLVGCQQSAGCAAYDKLWAQPGVMDQIPVLLEEATLGQDSGDIYVPRFTGPGMFAQADDVAEKALLGVAFPSEYRGLVLGFQAGMAVGSEMTLTWDSARLQQAPPSTVRLANLTAVTSANMPKADPAILAKIQTTMDNGKPLGLPGNLVALVVEAAQDDDIDALLKLCQPCTDSGYKAKFIAEMTRSAIPYSSGRFDELAQALMTHPAVANNKSVGLFYPGYDQSWSKPWSTDNPNGPKPEVDAADKAKYAIGHMDGYIDVKTTFLLVDDGPDAQSAWLGLDGLQ